MVNSVSALRKYKMSQEIRKCFKIGSGVVKGHRSQLKETADDQILDNTSDNINNKITNYNP